VQIAGVEVSGLVATNNNIQFVMPDVQHGQQDLVVLFSYGALTVQEALACQERKQPVFSSWTTKVSDSPVKIYARDIEGIGKVSIFLNGLELAGFRAVNNQDQKLRVLDGAPYLVRTVSLRNGKNQVQVLVDGKTAWSTELIR
jgi:hypothetical protein